MERSAGSAGFLFPLVVSHVIALTSSKVCNWVYIFNFQSPNSTCTEPLVLSEAFKGFGILKATCFKMAKKWLLCVSVAQMCSTATAAEGGHDPFAFPSC